eukprot:946082-Rhodomonas_salina.1
MMWSRLESSVKQKGAYRDGTKPRKTGDMAVQRALERSKGVLGSGRRSRSVEGLAELAAQEEAAAAALAKARLRPPSNILSRTPKHLKFPRQTLEL